MKTQNAQVKQTGPRIVWTSSRLLVRLNTYGAAVVALLFAGATLLGTSAALAATITVINTNDSGPGSLRQALVGANDGDTINFDPSLNGHKIKLTSGQLNVNKDIKISGPGANNLAVDGNAQSRVFYVNPRRTVTVSGLTITNGNVTNNFGGGVYNDGAALTVRNCTISGSKSGGGGIVNYGFNGSATLTVSNCAARGNVGGGIWNLAGAVTLSNCTVSDNSDGGGIFNLGRGRSAMLKVTNCTVSGNSPGGIFNNGFHGSAMLTVANCAVSGNYGRGIDNSGTEGGAALTVSNCTLSGNSGGGIASVSGPGGSGVTVSNSTISGNSADYGGGILNAASVGGYSGVTVSNSTLSGNSATGNGGGIYNASAGGSTTLELSNTILNTGSSGGNIFNDAGTVTSHGYNLSSDNGGGYLTATGDQINTNPLLGPLQDNGGPTYTHALLLGSPAINAGDPTFTPPPFYDQRGPGFDRVVNGRIDIGSFEVQ
jgi:Right handed beta helix region